MYVTVCLDEMCVTMMMLTINNAAIKFAGLCGFYHEWCMPHSMRQDAPMRCMLLSMMMLIVNDARIGF